MILNKSFYRLPACSQHKKIFIPSKPHSFVPNFAKAGPATPTADDEVGVEDAQSGLVGTLLVIDGRRDDEAKRDAGDALQHNQDDDQHQRAFVWHL